MKPATTFTLALHLAASYDVCTWKPTMQRCSRIVDDGRARGGGASANQG